MAVKDNSPVKTGVSVSQWMQGLFQGISKSLSAQKNVTFWWNHSVWWSWQKLWAKTEVFMLIFCTGTQVSETNAICTYYWYFFRSDHLTWWITQSCRHICYIIDVRDRTNRKKNIVCLVHFKRQWHFSSKPLRRHSKQSYPSFTYIKKSPIWTFLYTQEP